jgi:hypothetical protein
MEKVKQNIIADECLNVAVSSRTASGAGKEGLHMKNRHLYPPNWKELSAKCREQAGKKCQICGIVQGAKRISRAGKEYTVYLQAAHRNHSERHSEQAGLLCLCAICHWWYDFEHLENEADRRIFRLKVEQIKKKADLERANEDLQNSPFQKSLDHMFFGS